MHAQSNSSHAVVGLSRPEVFLEVVIFGKQSVELGKCQLVGCVHIVGLAPSIHDGREGGDRRLETRGDDPFESGLRRLRIGRNARGVPRVCAHGVNRVCTWCEQGMHMV